MFSPEQFLTAVLSDQSVQFAIALVITLICLFILGYVAEAVRADARLSKYVKAFELIGSKSADWIVTLRYGNIDLSNYNGIDYNDKAVALTELFGRDIDPRMAFLLDRLDEEVVAKLGLKIETEEVLAAAERKYNELRYGNNGLILNPKDAPAAPVVAQAAPAKHNTRVSQPIPSSLKN
jgi:hypothetical protein